MFLSSAHLDDLASRYSRIASFRGRGESAADQMISTVETVGFAGLAAYANARYSEPGKTHVEILGVPADLSLGLLLGGASLFGVFGRFDEHGNNVANGLLSAYAVRQGSVMGAEHRVASASEGGAQRGVAGFFGAGAPRGVYPTVDSHAVSGAYGWER